MKKVINPATNDCQLIIGIGDYHDKNHPANVIQRAYLESLIKKCRFLKSKFIVEDLSSVNDDGKGMCCNYIINAQGGILGKLADVARRESVDVDNVEYRYCRVTALGPLLNNPQLKPHSFSSSSSIIVDALNKEVHDEIKKIQNYNDGAFLNALYKRTAHEVSKSLSQLMRDNVANQSIAEYCTHLQKKEYIKNLEKLCVFDSALIDMKIVHSVMSAPYRSIIFVAAGGSHIEKISTLLEFIGYQKIIASSPNVSVKHRAIENAFGSDKKKVNTGFLPEPIDMHFLDQFID